jgi:hypothetical protein
MAGCAGLGGNITGVSFLTVLLAAKRLELLHQFVPKATTIAHLVNPNIPNTEADRREVQAAAQAVGQQLLVLDVSSEHQIETAFVPWFNAAPVRCKSATARSCSPNGNELSRSRPDMGFRRCIPCASLSQPAA